MILHSQSANEFQRQRILVTGASGFIGSQLCRRLFDAGGDVYAISRSPRPEGDNSVYWSVGDLANIKTVRQLFSSTKPDVIFHLASHVSGSRDLSLVLPTFQSNLASTVNLLTVATEMGCRRIVIVGSMEEPSQDDADATPCSPYAASKWSSTAYGRMFHTLYKTPIVIARVFMTYGPGQRDTQKLIPYVILSLLQGTVPRLSSGSRNVDWIYVNDVVNGLLAAGCKDGVDGCTIDLGSGEMVSVRMVVEQLVRLLGSSIEPHFGALPDRPVEQERRANTADALAQLGWRPETQLVEGLESTVDWYKRNGTALIGPTNFRPNSP